MYIYIYKKIHKILCTTTVCSLLEKKSKAKTSVKTFWSFYRLENGNNQVAVSDCRMSMWQWMLTPSWKEEPKPFWKHKVWIKLEHSLAHLFTKKKHKRHSKLEPHMRVNIGTVNCVLLEHLKCTFIGGNVLTCLLSCCSCGLGEKKTHISHRQHLNFQILRKEFLSIPFILNTVFRMQRGTYFFSKHSIPIDTCPECLHEGLIQSGNCSQCKWAVFIQYFCIDICTLSMATVSSIYLHIVILTQSLGLGCHGWTIHNLFSGYYPRILISDFDLSELSLGKGAATICSR